MAASSSTMAMRRFIADKATGCARTAKALRRCHFPPQLAGAAALLRPPRDRSRTWNTPVAPRYHGITCSTLSALNAPLARRRERLRNWLALLALLAVGIL